MAGRLSGLWDRGSVVLVTVVVTIVLCGFVKCESEVEAAERWPTWTAEERLDTGRCMMAEDSSGKDWPAIGHCLIKQWRMLDGRRTYYQQVHEYCALFSKLSPRWQGKRPDRIRRSTWSEPLDRGKGEAPEKAVERWERLRAFIDRFARREVRDPCPRCLWWGGPRYDVISPNWTCPLCPPETHNCFCYPQR